MEEGLLIDKTETMSLEDARKKAILLSPKDDQELSAAKSSQVSVEDSSLSKIYGAADSSPKMVVKNINGEQQEAYERAAEEYRLVKDAQREREEQLLREKEEAFRRKRKAEKEELKRKERMRREEEQRQLAIRQAVLTRRRIQETQAKIKKEAMQCASWSKEKSGDESLGRQIHGMWMSLRPSTKQMADRNSLVKDVQEVLEAKWPGCGLRLIPFGSTQTGLIEATSDVDLTLIDPMRPYGVGTPQSKLLEPPKDAVYGHLANSNSISAYGMEKLPDYYSVQMIASALRRSGGGKFRQIVPIAKAKVPIVKFVHRRSSLSSDINVNDVFGNVNSEMIRAYIDINPDIIRPYLFVIKKWASRRSINDPAGKSGICSLNSYTICMIALQYLQIRGIVPNLQSTDLVAALDTQKTFLWQKPSNSTRSAIAKIDGVKSDRVKDEVIISGDDFELDPNTGARRFETTFAKISDAIEGKDFFKVAQQVQTSPDLSQSRPNPKEPIFEKMGLLLKGFFTWISEFDLEECGISLRLGGPFRRRQHPKNKELLKLPYIPPPPNDWRRDNAIVCQDPFILDRNTANISRQMRKIIVDECWRARALLEEERESDCNLLSDLLLSFDHEQMVRQHEVVMTSFDKETQNIILQRATEK